jgi:probable phosphoglycerate mutase
VELLLIRHARPTRLDGEPGGPPADPGLDREGHRQAESLATWLSDESIDAIWSSTMRRAVETAAPLGDRLDLPVHPEPDLIEADHDATSYVPLEEMGPDAWEDPVATVFGDQDPEVFRQRVAGALNRIASAHPSASVAVVCHGAVINSAVADVLGLAVPLFFAPGYTSISRVLVDRSGRRSLWSLNETAHLRGEPPVS